MYTRDHYKMAKSYLHRFVRALHITAASTNKATIVNI